MAEQSRFKKLRESERNSRKGILVEAFLELLEEFPFYEIGMRDIAARAGVSAAAIYRYFPSREDLFIEAFVLDISTIIQRFKKRVGGETISIEEFTNVVVDHLIDSDATYNMMSFIMVKTDISSKHYYKLDALLRFFFDEIEGMLIDDGGDYTEEMRFIAHAFFSSLLGVLMTFRNYPGRSKEDIRKHIHRLASITAMVFKEGLQRSSQKT